MGTLQSAADSRELGKPTAPHALLQPNKATRGVTRENTTSFLRATQRVSHKKSLGKGKGNIVKDANRRNQECLRSKPEQFE